MIIGVPKEIKNNENRVAITPAGVLSFVNAGHEVQIEDGAGLGSGISNDAYVQAGATIVSSAAEAWSAEMVMKVKEPQQEEFIYFRKNLILFTYLHLAAESALTHKLMEKKVTAIAYETIQLDNGSLPLLTPMSEVAGRMSVQVGIHSLEKFQGGKGVLISGVPGVKPANVVIIGGGVVGTNAAKMAVGLGANVTILDVNPERLRQLDDLFEGRVQTVISDRFHIAEEVKKADLLIGAVLIPGARAPQLVTESMIKEMEPGSVVVDVAIDQGGSIETVDHTTTHDQPTYVKHGVIHYSVANMPGAVARTATYALTNATGQYGLFIANQGFEQAVLNNPAVAKGVNTFKGEVTFQAVAQAMNLPFTPLETLVTKEVVAVS
ncbi:alanine dehydrogenase [Paenibacillus taichungensis]|uniref:Alanine dehydrogenase n=1 Tax=Paenibacillus taichungensis TaxID=484184 RepID=A0A329QQ79_9BACL|nr:alanine dehydrogenase [Paenibacillus taichungensis]RAW13502.1 alanine dehydrogenase [Paenibacillus taichungensis]